MSKIKILAGQRWLKSTGPYRDQNVILHILEATPRRFYAITHVVGVNSTGDNGPLLGVECEQVPALIGADCLLMGDGETALQCVARHALQTREAQAPASLSWRALTAGEAFPIAAKRGKMTYIISKTDDPAIDRPYRLAIIHAGKRTNLKARWASLSEAQARCE